MLQRFGSVITLATLLFSGLSTVSAAGSGSGREARLGIASSLVLLDEDLAGPDGSAVESEIGAWVLFPFLGPFEGRAELGYSKFGTDTFRGETESLIARAMAEYAWRPERRDYWFAAVGGGYMELDFDRAQSFSSALASVGFGRSFSMTARSRLRWELRAEHTLAEDGLTGEDLFQVGVLVGLSWGVGGSGRRDGDSDGDGVRDALDRCPDSDSGVSVDRQGCPAVGATRPADRRVEPREEELPDADGDGVPDPTDRCPNTMGGIEVDTSGCPRDDDGDGIHDGLGMDKCPGTPAGARVDAHGCPIDGDGDGVYDGLDRCPETPSGARVDGAGCAIDG